MKGGWRKNIGSKDKASFETVASAVREMKRNWANVSETMKKEGFAHYVEDRPSGFKFQYSFMALGYLEFITTGDAKGLNYAKIGVGGEAGLTCTQQFTVGPVPVYFKLGFGGQFILWFVNTDNMKEIADLLKNVSGEVTIYADAEAGVGIADVLSVAIGGRLDLIIQFTLAPEQTSEGTLMFAASVRLQVFVFKYKWDFAKATAQLWKTTGEAPLDDMISSALSSALGSDSGRGSFEFEDSSFLSRPSVFVGADSSYIGPDSTVAESDSDRTVMTNVSSGSNPKIVQIKGWEYLFWLEANPAKDVSNRNELRYAYRKIGGDKFCDPKTVYDKTCVMDFEPLVYQDTLYVAFQAASRILPDGLSADDAFMELCKASEIYVSKYKWGVLGYDSGFDAPDRLTDNNSFDGRLRFGSDGGDYSTLIWANNSESDYFLQKGNTNVHCRRFKKGKLDKDWTQVDINELFISLNTTTVGGTCYEAYLLDKDGKLETINDRSLMIGSDGQGYTVIESDKVLSHPEFGVVNGRRSLIWFSDGAVKSRPLDTPKTSYGDSATATILTAEQNQSAGDFNDDFRVLSSKKGVEMLVWSKRDITTHLYTGYALPCVNGVWADKPVPVTKCDKHVFAPQGYVRDDKSAIITYRRQWSVEPGEIDTAQNDIGLGVFPCLPDLDIASAVPLDRQVPGKTIRLKTVVRNLGVAIADGVHLRVHVKGQEANPLWQKDFSSVKLKPGDEAELEAQYTIPNPNYRHDFVLEARPLPLNKAKNAGVNAKSTLSYTVGVPKVEVRRAYLTRDRSSGKGMIRASVDSVNGVAVAQCQMEIYKNAFIPENLIAKEDVGSLDGVEPQWKEFSVDFDTMKEKVQVFLYRAVNADAAETGDESSDYSSDPQSLAVANPLADKPFSLSDIKQMLNAGTMYASVIAGNNHPKQRKATLTFNVYDSLNRCVNTQSINIELPAYACEEFGFTHTYKDIKRVEFIINPLDADAGWDGQPPEPTSISASTGADGGVVNW